MIPGMNPRDVQKTMKKNHGSGKKKTSQGI